MSERKMTADEINSMLAGVESDLGNAQECLEELAAQWSHPDLPRLRRQVTRAYNIMQGIAA